LRQSLVPGLLKNIEKNAQNFSKFKIFEIGKVFCPEEKKKVAGLIFQRENNCQKEEKNIYKSICEEKCFYLKNIIETLFNRLGIDKRKIVYPQNVCSKGIVKYKDEEIGFIGEKQGITAYFELDFNFLLNVKKQNKKYQKIIPYPQVKRDLAFLINKGVSWKQIFESLNNISDLIIGLEPFDIFQDKEFGNKCNLGFHIIYQSAEQTLNNKQIQVIEEKIIKVMEEKFQAKLRDF